MNTNKMLPAALLACAFAPAFALDLDEAPAAQRGEHHFVTRGGDNVRIQVGNLEELRALDGMPFGAGHMGLKPVTNAPYSAEIVTERQQNLADGNQIVTRHSSMSYRDSAGRTRNEQRSEKGEPRLITINDPVAHLAWVLHPQEMTATKMVRHDEIGRAAREAARARIEQLRKEGKLPRREGEEVIVKRVERAGDGAEQRVMEDVRIRVERAGADGKSGMAQEMSVQLAPVLSGAFGDMKWSANATTKQLGSREIDGVKAEGKLRSYEIPAGAVGNRNPIVVSDESWYSPELQVTLYSKHSDPRYGDSIVRLEGLRRGEPAAALFTVPSDYKVKDALANLKRFETKPQ